MMLEGSDTDGERDVVSEPSSRRLLSLNSHRLTAAHLRHIAGAMEFPSTGSADVVRQLIEGKVQKEREVIGTCKLSSRRHC